MYECSVIEDGNKGHIKLYDPANDQIEIDVELVNFEIKKFVGWSYSKDGGDTWLPVVAGAWPIETNTVFRPEVDAFNVNVNVGVADECKEMGSVTTQSITLDTDYTVTSYSSYNVEEDSTLGVEKLVLDLQTPENSLIRDECIPAANPGYKFYY